MSRTRSAAIAAAFLTLLGARSDTGIRWSDEERATIASLRLAALEAMASDPSNRWADDARAAALGQRLFFDRGLSRNDSVSCATCHDARNEFQDGTALARGVGTTDRRTMPVASTAWSPWQFWDGRKDSQWSQALGPLESAVEHGTSRTQVAHRVAARHRSAYEAVFGALPNLARAPRQAGPVADPAVRAAWDAMSQATRDSVTRVFVNVGKAIAAYERRLVYGPSRFDRYADAVTAGDRSADTLLSPDEVAGLRLFIGKASCVTCHNGPRFTDDHFHNTGVPPRAGRAPDRGREAGARLVVADEFNCRSRWSDAGGACAELEFLDTANAEMVAAFKTPSLRNAALRPPYMHAGQLATLDDVVAHYDRAPRSAAGRTELRPLRLSPRERTQLVAFVRTLSAPLAVDEALLVAPR